MWQWLRHAFFVEPPGAATPDEREREVVDQLASAIVQRKLTAPALLFLESSRPLNYIGSQTLVFFQPITSWLFRGDSYRVFHAFLERRGSVEYICRRIEHYAAGCADEASRSQIVGDQ